MISTISRSSIMLLAGFTLMLAQEPPASGGWRRVTDPPPGPEVQQSPVPADAFGQPIGQTAGQNAPAAQPAPPPASVPDVLTLPPGTFVNVRINQMLTSNHNQPGDSFSATLTQPVVVDGIVVAQRGQTVYGRVADVQKHRSSKPSQLAIELTEITLVDGTQVPVRSQLVARQGGTTPTGQQIGTVATTTTVGAAVGAMADWGRGAAIGAGVGAAAGLAGVMLTRNRPTEVYPETPLTFRIDARVTISTARAPVAYRYVDSSDYNAPNVQLQQRTYEPRRVYAPSYGYGYDPYYWGPGISFVYGSGYWGRGGWGWGGGRYWGRSGWRRWR